MKNRNGEKLYSKPVKSELSLGCKAKFYQAQTAEELLRSGENKGWYATVGFYDKWADYTSNSWTSEVVDGPFRTEQEAEQAGEKAIEDGRHTL